MYSEIKLVFIDVDGTLTDGVYQISGDGQTILKSFYTRDWYGIEQIMKNDIPVIILTQSHDDVILQQIERICSHSIFWDSCLTDGTLMFLRGINNKRETVEMLFGDDLSWENVAYIGDAENDFECIELAAFSGCPTDAVPYVRDKAMYPSDYFGGRGAVHDFCMYIIEQRDKEKKDENA